MIFLDASILVAILGREEDAASFASRVEADGERLCSAVARWETITALVRGYGYRFEDAERLVDDTLVTFAARLVPIGEREGKLAGEAYARYGRGRHPAALNMGDCFAYACAKANAARLLYKGEDFAQTDLA